MSYETLDIRLDARGVAYVTLNLPEKRNALSAAMIDELTHMAQTLGARSTTRAVVLAGAGKVFCAGGDDVRLHAGFEQLLQAELRRLGFLFT